MQIGISGSCWDREVSGHGYMRLNVDAEALHVMMMYEVDVKRYYTHY